VDDLAAGCLHLLAQENPPDWVNIGYGSDITIREAAELVKKAVGYTGDIVFDTTKPDGTPRKLMDSTRIHKLGWQARIPLEEGLKGAYQDFLGRMNA
jgi:GDP-L-fucose synthase